MIRKRYLSIFLIFLIISTVLLFNVIGVTDVHAFPSKTKHTHNEKTIKWELDGTRDGDSAHNHRSAHSFDTVSYDALGCWDNRDFHYKEEGTFHKGHGFIDERSDDTCPRYYFSPTFGTWGGEWPVGAVIMIVSAFNEWGKISADADEGLVTGIRFKRVMEPPAEIRVYWVDLEGDPSPCGYVNNLDGGTPKDPITVEFDSKPTDDKGNPVEWYFGRDASECPSNEMHFFTVALHEVGHVLGLDHPPLDQPGQSVMQPGNWSESPFLGSRQNKNDPGTGYCFDEIDEHSIEGALDLYSQPCGCPYEDSSTTLSFCPTDINDEGLTPDSTFNVLVCVTNVVDLYSYMVMLQYDPDVLTAINITKGHFFHPHTSHMIAWIDETRGVVRIFVSLIDAPTGVTETESGWLATITFYVNAVGESPFEPYYTLLYDSNLDGIEHVIHDGYFSNMPTNKIVLKGRGAWPEHAHFDISRDEDFNGTHANQTLFGRVENLGIQNLSVYMTFDIIREDDHALAVVTTELTVVTPLTTVDLTANLTLTSLDAGKYDVIAKGWYIWSGYIIQGEEIKTLKFTVVP